MYKIIFSLACLFLTNQIFAYQPVETDQNNRFVVALSAGPTWTFGNESETFYLQPDVIKTYQASNHTVTFASGEIFLGWQNQLCITSLNQSLLSQIGVAFAAAGNAELSGNIWEDANPEFDNYSYYYKINHAYFAIKGRLIANNASPIEPYITASIGVGYNRAYNFDIVAKIPEEVPAPAFRSNTMTTFSYTLGIGVQTNFSSPLQVAIGYEFADWGKVQLARAEGQTLNHGVSLNHLYANQLQITLIYIA